MPNKDDILFCIDSSVLINLEKVSAIGLLPSNLWDLLDELFVLDRVISHKIVFDEICPVAKKPGFLAGWVKNKEDHFLPKTDRQAVLVTEILRNFPNLIKPNNEKEQADPWLIALVMEKRESSNLIEDYSGLTLVSSERGSSDKIPIACDHFKVPHIDLRRFFEINGWIIPDIVRH